MVKTRSDAQSAAVKILSAAGGTRRPTAANGGEVVSPEEDKAEARLLVVEWVEMTIETIAQALQQMKT